MDPLQAVCIIVCPKKEEARLREALQSSTTRQTRAPMGVVVAVESEAAVNAVDSVLQATKVPGGAFRAGFDLGPESVVNTALALAIGLFGEIPEVYLVSHARSSPHASRVEATVEGLRARPQYDVWVPSCQVLDAKGSVSYARLHEGLRGDRVREVMERSGTFYPSAGAGGAESLTVSLPTFFSSEVLFDVPPSPSLYTSPVITPRDKPAPSKKKTLFAALIVLAIALALLGSGIFLYYVRSGGKAPPQRQPPAPRSR